ncbi:MAG: ankyrin repeat domain-containing protein [Alphaproteobacteria bacterium]|jgi:ankyrin repeat protein
MYVVIAILVGALTIGGPTLAQQPPNAATLAGYTGLHAAAAAGDVAGIRRLAAAGADLESRDENGRTPLHVAAFVSHDAAVAALAAAGADVDAFDNQDYDIVTIAAVANDPELLRGTLALGADPGATTSPYRGTALIAAAHLGHDQIVRILIDAGAPLDHINNLGWTALIEAVLLGDGGPRHVATVRALVAAGASRDIADRDGATPLDHASRRGYDAMVALLGG